MQQDSKMCDKAVDTHPTTIKYIPECYKTQDMCYKAVHRCFLLFDSIPSILFDSKKLKKYIS